MAIYQQAMRSNSKYVDNKFLKNQRIWDLQEEK